MNGFAGELDELFDMKRLATDWVWDTGATDTRGISSDFWKMANWGFFVKISLMVNFTDGVVDTKGLDFGMGFYGCC